MPTFHRTALALTLFVTATLSCSDDKPPPPPASDTPVSTGWRSAVGEGGAFVQTFDGMRWESRTVASVDLLSVACIGNLDGWVAGKAGAIGRTRDGGKTWAWQESHLSADLRAIRFGDRTHGLAAGDLGALAVTDDGGMGWRVIATPVTSTLRGTAVAYGASLYLVVGDSGVVLRSADAGKSWTQSKIEGASDLRAVAVDYAGHRAIAVDASGAIFASGDLGLHFAKEWAAAGPLHGVAMNEDGTRALAVGAKGTLLVSDASRAWATVSSGSEADLYGALVADNRLYAAGDTGTLLVSLDGLDGARWSRVPLGTSANLRALEDL